MVPSSPQHPPAHLTASGEPSFQIFHICVFIIYLTANDHAILLPSWQLLKGLGMQALPFHPPTLPPPG